MTSEHVIGKRVPDIVGAIFKRLGRDGQARGVERERFVIVGRVNYVEIARRTLALHSDGRVYCVSWDDETVFMGTSVSNVPGTEVIVHARANIVGLQADSVAVIADQGREREAFSDVPEADCNIHRSEIVR